MNILIIGSGGQLGFDCAKVLSGTYQVIPVDFPEIDITSRQSLDKAWAAHQPQVVINCAAYTAVDKCETDTDNAWRVNADGPRNIGEIAMEYGSRVIHVSTDYVFDGKKQVPSPYVEDDPVNPLSEYGRSKLAGEQMLQARCPAALILRTAWLYSANGPNFLKTMLRLALSDPARAFTIVHDQFGSMTWSLTLATQIEKLLDTDLSGIVHTTADGYSSWYEAACYFLEKMEVAHSFVPCTTEDYPTPAHRPANSILRNKVLDDRGISLFRSWQEDVDRFTEEHGSQLLEEARAERAAS
ncbi:MAG: dTDP-4-dehydrorhamnose reductase [Desulfofustis sp.]|nr:dTDP-4-dehydrorhamnose reductase [Desulfofustis sp.]